MTQYVSFPPRMDAPGNDYILTLTLKLVTACRLCAPSTPRNFLLFLSLLCDSVAYRDNGVR